VGIPSHREEDVLRTADMIDAAEAEIREALAVGSQLDEARRTQNYHLLQRRETAEK
jgi:4-hydroxy-4-methyl-2-oxoglutarate aldolase